MKLIAPLVGVVMLAGAVPVALGSGGVNAPTDTTTTTAPATTAPASPAPTTPTAPATTPAAPAEPVTTASVLPGPGAVQRALGVPVTHQWDHRTRQAIRAFQRTHGLVVDGVVGPKTAAALGLTATDATAASGAHSSSSSSELRKIAMCESGGNPTAVSPDGQYRGKYQFSRATWRLMGGTGDPAKAPESEQDARAAKLLASDGPTAWPTCG